ncbi:cyclic nucleotide-binding domain-containing protein [Candidatus Ferrigenium straubiae]|jgi:CRP-like cAMP-binding protein/thioredoxin reductase/Fe-S-cluster-containing hydrogenase component 2|uniref:cyclic nucleotide-binding domain-containing protein n=1 Tax=Candidatus Ferrigenium straubiae TaxID=2919506 RepID=UPI003F4AA211
MTEKFKIAIIGAGPAGLSAAAHAAELGISHVLLEAAPHPANTIHKYQKGKLVMAEPAVLPLRSPMAFAAGTRENILKTWYEDLQKHKVNLRLGAQVNGIAGERGGFQIALSSGQAIGAEFVVLAIGLQGNIHKLGVQGQDLPNVQYQLDDPEEFKGETIVVVGGGDAGVENALALAQQNRVILINREEEFSRCKEGNFTLLQAAIKTGQIEPRANTRVDYIDTDTENGFLLRVVAKTPEGIESVACHRVIARLGASPPRKLLESFGVKFSGSDITSAPELSEQYESNVPGLYIIGALGGYPLIKQALNQGYEAIEYILGNHIEPADEPLLKQKISSLDPSCAVHEGLAIIRRNAPILAGLTALQLRELLLESSILTPKPDEIIFKYDDYTSSFFSILEGELAVLVKAKDGREIYFQIKAGNFFGEMGLISGRRRSATIKAITDCVLIETPRRSMLKLINSVESVRQKLDEISMKRVVRNCLTNTLPESELNYLLQGATIKRYKAGDVLFHQGDKADGLYLIRRGSVIISRMAGGKEDVMSYVVTGNYFGEMALISDKPRSTTARAASATEVVLLKAPVAIAVLERNSDLRDLFAERYRENAHEEKIVEPQGKPDNLFTFLIQQGVGEATDVLLIDYSLCIRCNNCETACANTHGGISLFNREAGPTHGHIHVPASCRHCEHPYCMLDCPPNVIHRSVNGEVFIADGCIGCGNCKNNCPYDAIQMVAVNPKFKKPGLWQALLGGTNHHESKHIADEASPKKAIKCDLCKDNAMGPACVRSCPTGAALRISPEALSLTMRDSSATLE